MNTVFGVYNRQEYEGNDNVELYSSFEKALNSVLKDVWLQDKEPYISLHIRLEETITTNRIVFEFQQDSSWDYQNKIKLGESDWFITNTIVIEEMVIN